MLWVLISIICPLVLPVFCMLGLKAVPAFAPNANLMAPVKDGQLCWGALAMCLSAMYEALFPGQTSILGSDGRAMSILQFAILLIFSSLIAAGGAIAPTPLAIPAGTPCTSITLPS